MTRDEFVAKWRSVIQLWILGPDGTERARQAFEVNLDALLKEIRAEEREDTLADGDALRDALRGPRW